LDLVSTAVAFAIVLASLTVHEAAHAWTADRLGDPTARLLGRVSLNPIVHIDLVGTIILPLVATVSGLPILGWAKPVPVNVRGLGHPKRDFMIVAAAGPASNVALAVIGSGIFHAAGGFTAGLGTLTSLMVMTVSINLLLAVFNMLPVPPLDGGNVLAGLLPDTMNRPIQALRQYGFIILYALILTDLLWKLIGPPFEFLRGLLL
jgi:Zn-dependent protease